MIQITMANAYFHYHGSLQIPLSYGPMQLTLEQWLCIPFTGDKAYFKQFPIVVVMLKT